MNLNSAQESQQQQEAFVTAHSPVRISPEEWKEIAKSETVIDGWGLHDWSDDERPEVLSGSVYGVKFNFTSGCPGYCGDLYILLGDTYEEPLMLLRNSTTGKLFTYCPSWGTYDDAPDRLPSRVSLGHGDARRIYDTLSGARDPFMAIASALMDVKLETGDVIDKLEKGYLSGGSGARHAQSMVDELRGVLKRIDAIQRDLQRHDRDLGSASEMFARFSEPRGWPDRR